MEFEEINAFLETTADRLEDCWNLKILSHIANQRIPDFIMSSRGTLLRADVHILWTQWFIESICDPEKFADSNHGYSHIYRLVQNRIPYIFNSVSESERKTLTKYIARLIDKEIELRSKKNV